MAKVIKRKNELVEKRNRQTITHIIGYVLCLLCGILAIELGFANKNGVLYLILTALSLAGAVMIHCTRDGVGILSAGVSGEQAAVRLLQQGLPDSYVCITNAQIQYENRHNELDVIVAGPSGIYVVEVKNVTGRICGSYTDKVLSQEKGKRSKEMNNPVYQVKTHADILSRYLKANGIRTWVQGVVLFVNPRAQLEIEDIPSNGIPVFAVSEGAQEALCRYVAQPSGIPMKPEEIAKLIDLV